MKQLLLMLALTACALPLAAQNIGTDGENQSVFTNYSSRELTLQLTTSAPLTLSKAFTFKKTPKWYLDKTTGKRVETMTKLHQFSAQLSMLNSGDDGYLTLKNMRPGIGAKFGYQVTTDTFKRLDVVGGAITGGFNGIFKMDNIDLYDTDNNTRGTRLPLTYGVEGYFNWFLPNGHHRSFLAALAVTGTLKHTWNKEDLINFQNIGSVTILPDIVALKEFKGKYGAFRSNITSGRFSLAVPMYYSNFNLIPYVVYNKLSAPASNYRMGAFLNILSKPLESTNIIIPSSLGFGVDWINKGGKFSGANFILTGVIKI